MGVLGGLDLPGVTGADGAERSFDFSTVLERATKSATCVHRATWRVEPGTVFGSIYSDYPHLHSNLDR